MYVLMLIKDYFPPAAKVILGVVEEVFIEMGTKLHMM